MSEVRSGSQAVAAALVGSLTSFSLIDIVELLGRTDRTGELQVVGKDVDRRIWVDSGDLVETDPATPDGGGLFELACIEDGWFYFTVDDKVPEGARTSIASVIGDLGAQVTEWRSLVAELPFESVVQMSTTTPGADVQIRADQWQVLSTVGTGRTVREVIDIIPLHPLDSLRTLKELAGAQLISVRPPESTAEEAPASAPAPADEPAQLEAPETAESTAEKGPDFATRLPLPPFAPAGVPPAVPGDDASGTPVPPAPVAQDDAAPGAVPPAPPGPPLTIPPLTIPPVPSPPPPPPPVPAAAGVATTIDAVATPVEGEEVRASVMPPPISGDPWSTIPPPGTPAVDAAGS